MRLFFVAVFLCVSFLANATNYYFSDVSGDDSRSSSQAQNQATPWKSIAKLNSFFGSISAGDSILFKRGEVFYGSVVCSKSGTAANPIKFGAYGSGAKPVISGFTNVSSWTNLGSNIWESTNSVSSLSAVNMVVIKGTNTAMGRFPNTGYMSYESHTSNNSITDNQLSSSPNWTGAEVVIKMTHWVINRSLITNHSGTKISYASTDNNYTPTNGFGYFFQNDVRTLDLQNEWYYDPSSKKLKIFSTVNPGSVQVSSLDDLVTATSKNYLVFHNLSLQGANNRAFYIGYSSNISIQNCDINYSGIDAIDCYPNAPSIDVENCVINNSNNGGVLAFSSDNALIKNNTISNTGTFAGMGKGVAGNYEAIISNGNNSEISYNTIKNTGYCGIKFDGNATVVKNNYIDYYCFIKDDGAGIYGYPTQSQTSYTQRTIKDNIVINAIGAEGGTDDASYLPAEGIYLDASASFADVTNNSIANCVNLGLFLNNSKNVNATGNTIYNCAALLRMTKFQNVTVVNNTFNNNKLVARTASQRVLYLSNDFDNAANYFTGNNNYYARPIDDNITVIAFADGLGGGYYTLATWKLFSGQDANSKKSPKAITNVNDLRFEFNETGSSKTINLGANYIDVANIAYPGTITLAPYSSAILIKNGTGNVLPTANAGPDQTITLPLNLTSLIGTGNDPDGTIASYAWTKISGPTAGTITSPTLAITTLTGLVQGIYQFELKVTDNAGGAGKDTVQVNVISAVNQAPTANAGNDKVIYLPASSVTLSGTAADVDGTISSVRWTKVAGPTSVSITNATSATTTVNALTEGIYLFEFKVTDNAGAIGTDTVQVTVSNSSSSAYGGTPWPIPGTIQAEDFDNGGQNVAYFDSTPENLGDNYRFTESVDIQAATEGGSNIGWTDPDEWMKYSVRVLNSGTYSLQVRVASLNSVSSLRVEMDGTTIAIVSVPNTGGYQTWQTVTIPNISLTAGLKTMRVYCVTGGFNFNYVTFVSSSNLAPTANAGNNQSITLPTNSVVLTGSGTDADGTIASYLWTKVSGPATGSISNSTSATATANGLVLGIYGFELKVTDNAGATGKDTVYVTVNTVANQAPTANAGFDQFITLPVSSITLSGSGTDSDGTIAAYLWTKISGPASGTITNAAAANTTVTGLAQGIYKFELRVTDNAGAIGRDTMQLIVNAGNQAPVANAGPDQTITLPTNSVTLTGSGTDNDGTITSYNWSKVSGPSSGTIANASAATTTVTSLVQGTYKFELIVTDNSGAIGRDTVQVTVNNSSNSAYGGVPWPIPGTIQVEDFDIGGQNVAYYDVTTENSGGYYRPTESVDIQASSEGVANIGWTDPGEWMKYTVNVLSTGTYTLQVRVASLNAVSSFRVEMNGVTLATFTSPNTGGYQTWQTVSLANINLTAGIKTMRIYCVTGGFNLNYVSFVSNTPSNQPPVANAGVNQSITLPVNSVTLTGTGTDSDGSIVAYAWTKVSGPIAGSISAANSAVTAVTGLAQGVYGFELKVTDNAGAVGKDTVYITVNPASSNISPVANAGADKTIALPTNTVTLTGSGSDADGSIISYTWTKVSGPGTFAISNPGAASTAITNLVQGVYNFELKVTDNGGATGKATVKVTVTGVTNTPYTGTPLTIPGTIEIEDYDNGGQNLAYYDVTAENSGGYYRPLEAVDLQVATEGTAFMGWTNDTEWTKYTVNVTSAGTYTLVARVSTFSNISACRVEMDGVTIATIAIPNTNGYQTWQNVSIPNIQLTAGIKVMRFYVTVGGFNITRLIFNQTSGTSRNASTVVTAAPTQSRISTVKTEEGLSVNLFPNPVATTANLKLVNAVAGTYRLSLTDIFGKKVWTKTINNNSGTISENIDTRALSSGVYILEVITPDQKRSSYKMIKQ